MHCPRGGEIAFAAGAKPTMAGGIPPLTARPSDPPQGVTYHAFVEKIKREMHL